MHLESVRVEEFCVEMVLVRIEEGGRSGGRYSNSTAVSVIEVHFVTLCEIHVASVLVHTSNAVGGMYVVSIKKFVYG